MRRRPLLLAAAAGLAVALPGCGLTSGQVEPADRPVQPLASQPGAFVLQDGDARALLGLDLEYQASKGGTPERLQFRLPGLPPACEVTNASLDVYEGEDPEAVLADAASSDERSIDDPVTDVRQLTADDGGQGAYRTYTGTVIESSRVVSTLVAAPAGGGTYAVLDLAQNAAEGGCDAGEVARLHEQLLARITMPYKA